MPHTTGLSLPWQVYHRDGEEVSAVVADAEGEVIFAARPPRSHASRGELAAWLAGAAQQAAYLVVAANAHEGLALALAGLLAAVDRGEATPTAPAVVRARQALAAAREARS